MKKEQLNFIQLINFNESELHSLAISNKILLMGFNEGQILLEDLSMEYPMISNKIVVNMDNILLKDSKKR